MRKIKNIVSFFLEYIKYKFINSFNIVFPFHEYDYIVATKNGLYLTSIKRYIKIMRGQFYGVVKGQDCWYVFEALTSLSIGRILKISNNGYVETFSKNMSVGCHQLDIYNHCLFIADTYNNSIIEMELNKGAELKRHFPLGVLQYGRDSNNYAHINSLFFKNGYCYLVCHNETSKTGLNSEVLKCDLDFTVANRINFPAGNAHNVYLYGNKLITCDSCGKRVIDENGDVLVQLNFFTRGLSVTDDLVVVGESEYAKRGERHRKGGWINYFTQDFKFLARQRVPGMVQDVRALNAKDHCMSSTYN